MAHYNDLSYLGADAPNVNAETGIRFGWISQRSLNPDAVSDIIDNGADLAYAAAVDDAKSRIAAALRPVFDDLGVLPYGLRADRQRLSREYLADAADSVWDGIEQDFNDQYESDSSSYRYERDGYTLLLASDGDICVISSPFYTYAAFGSPCIPNAGHLDTPRGLEDGGVKTYCLAGDWFEDETAPYPVYRVDGALSVTT
jgi:hypothetical protein